MDLENIPQDSLQSSPSAPPRVRKTRSSHDPQAKLGAGTIGIDRASFMKSYYERRRILTVPREIADANPDKHFCFVSMKKMAQNGFWHNQGYRLYNLENDPENQKNEKFNSGIDNYVHRNEMALAWIPKEEHERRLIEFEVARGKKDLTEIITRNPNLRGAFSPHAREEKQTMRYSDEEDK